MVYGLQRFHAFGVPLLRYPILLTLALALLWAAGVLPGRWFGVGAMLALLALIVVGNRLLRARSYVSFSPGPLPAQTAAPLQTQDKLPIYATGLLGVEGKSCAFTCLPGFYRTFATGEHAVLCRAAQRDWLLVGEWPPEELGMWYAFVQPDDILELAWGTLRFGATRLPAVAVTYRLLSPPRGRRRARVTNELLYLASASPADAQRIYVDLQRELPAGVGRAASASHARRGAGPDPRQDRSS